MMTTRSWSRENETDTRRYQLVVRPIIKSTIGQRDTSGDTLNDVALNVVSIDGSARVKRGGGACNAIVWKLPEWIVVAAESKYLPDLTVNEAEYQGLLLGFHLLSSWDRGRLIICEDYNLVIRQMRGEIERKAPGLTPSSSTGIRSAENVAGPRVPTRQARLEPKRGQVSQHRTTSARRRSGYRGSKLRRFGGPQPAPGAPTPEGRRMWFNASGRIGFCEHRTKKSGS
ncbi:hypothetical protein L917_01241 [Phytophthora nicotianae]|uniref:RNase H type-1 domain-containing protein n=1 Tax=Phytophthora nicotianae TaxID=4792 RepID=W2LXR8_PHYNI|nr:hypothetical protein L917_01241 [Phytophthora nicotianae]